MAKKPTKGTGTQLGLHFRKLGASAKTRERPAGVPKVPAGGYRGKANRIANMIQRILHEHGRDFEIPPEVRKTLGRIKYMTEEKAQDFVKEYGWYAADLLRAYKKETVQQVEQMFKVSKKKRPKRPTKAKKYKRLELQVLGIAKEIQKAVGVGQNRLAEEYLKLYREMRDKGKFKLKGEEQLEALQDIWGYSLLLGNERKKLIKEGKMQPRKTQK